MEVVVENNFYVVTVSAECMPVCVCMCVYDSEGINCSLKVPKARFILDINDKSAYLVDNVLMNTQIECTPRSKIIYLSQCIMCIMWLDVFPYQRYTYTI